jgi:hypothetical protein
LCAPSDCRRDGILVTIRSCGHKTRNGTAGLGRLWPWNATRCLYHWDLRTRDELGGATWTHQQSPVRRVTTTPDHPIVQVRRVSAANQATFPAVHQGAFRKTLAASAATISATRAGETGSSACTAPAPRIFCPKAFLSRPTPAPPQFPRPSWRGARIAFCSAPSVITDRTSGPMARSLAMDRPRRPQRTRPLSDPGRSRLQ